VLVDCRDKRGVPSVLSEAKLSSGLACGLRRKDSRNRGPEEDQSGHDKQCRTTHLNTLGIKSQALLLIGEEILDVFALISLKLNNLTHLGVGHDGSIAGELLLDHLEDLLLVEFLGKSLDSGQRLATITLCQVNVRC
jgi:hypothetical protein